MASSHKTDTIKLNQWAGTDSPKREDFNQDNLLLEEALTQHFASSGHITAEEKESLSKAQYTVGSYTGTGTDSRTIEIGFRPNLMFLMAKGYSLSHVDPFTFMCYSFSGIATELGTTQGITLTDTGFTVTQGSNNSQKTAIEKLNSEAVVYIYIAFP